MLRRSLTTLVPCALIACFAAGLAVARAQTTPASTVPPPLILPRPSAPASGEPEAEAVPAPEEIYTRVRSAWRRRTIPPFTRYKITALYEASGKAFREDYHCFYRARDGRLKAVNIPVPPQENLKRMGGFPIWFFGFVIDTNPVEHPPLRIPTPRILPYAEFGLGAPGSEAPAATPAPSPEPLRELGRVTSVNRIYEITFAGVERVLETETYHLHLRPLRDPNANKLRELWADTRTFDVVRLEVSGVDALEPLGPDAARIDFTSAGGRRVIERVAALYTLRAFREVKHLVFLFREYEFPDRELLDERYELNFTPPPG
jgi:hypothetical protein